MHDQDPQFYMKKKKKSTISFYAGTYLEPYIRRSLQLTKFNNKAKNLVIYRNLKMPIVL